MKKRTVWTAEDGTEFQSWTEADAYSRSILWEKGLAEFLGDALNLSPEEASRLVGDSRFLWDAIRDNPKEFENVFKRVRPRAKRGRPKGSKNKKKPTGEAHPPASSGKGKVSEVPLKAPGPPPPAGADDFLGGSRWAAVR